MTLSQSEKQTPSKKRELWLDFLKGLCMWQFITFHVCQDIYISHFMSAALSAFLFAAGYVFRTYGSFSEFLIRKVRYLVMPIICFGLINMVMSVMWKGTDLWQRFVGIFIQMPGPDDDMWFIAWLFTMEVMYYGVLRLAGRLRLVSPLPLVLLLMLSGIAWNHYTGIVLPWHVVNASMFMIFLHAGHAFAQGNISVCRIIEPTSSVAGNAVIWIFILMILHVWLPLPGFDVHTHRYGDILRLMLHTACGVCVNVNLSRLCCRYIKGFFVKAMVFVGRNSLSYYGLQSKAITFLVSLLATLSITLSGWTLAMTVSTIALLLLAPVAVVIKEHLPFILGRGRLFTSGIFSNT